MARNINDVYNTVQFILRKQRGIFLTVAEFNQNINLGFLDAIEEWFSGYGTSQKLHDALRKLREYEPFVSNGSGEVDFQADYIHLLGTPFTIIGSTITKPIFIQEDEYPFAASSQLRPVDTSNPILIDTDTGFIVHPAGIHYGAYWYLRLPATAVLSVTQVGRVVTYDPGTSVQLETNEMYWDNIIAKALKFSGVNMSEQEVTAFGQMYNQETNA
jgi:hypothetical protein